MSKRKVLVVDDEPDIVRALSLRLKSNGYDVVIARDGLQATATAVREEPDLVILDIGMPCGDGHTVALRLRDNSKTCMVPIIALTARTAESDRMKAEENGVTRYFTKPFDPDTLMTAVHELTGQEGD